MKPKAPRQTVCNIPTNDPKEPYCGGKLKKINPAGGPPQTICDAPAGEGGSWNQSGDIVFAPNSTGPLARVPAAGGVPTAVTKLSGSETSHRWPQFLPDGRSFLFLSASAGPADLYVGGLDSFDRKEPNGVRGNRK